MKANEALIAWTPNTDVWMDEETAGQVQVGPLLQSGDHDWTAPYKYTGGAAYVAYRKLEGWLSIAMVFVDFHTLVVRDGIDPKVAHKAFLAIDEYRQRISPEIDGAEDPPDEEG